MASQYFVYSRVLGTPVPKTLAIGETQYAQSELNSRAGLTVYMRGNLLETADCIALSKVLHDK